MTFDLKRIVETLIAQEQEGYALYTEVAEQLEDSKAQKLFLKLAKDEVKHEANFKKLLSKVENGPKTELTQEDAEYWELLLSKFDPRTKEREQKAQKAWTKEDALKVAEGLERNAIFLLNELLALAGDPSEEKVLISALKEERLHLAGILQTQMDGVVSSLML